ncbi:MAG: MBL fold metallo-hydrolase [Micavibrio aeruginosavorus]|uniref:MBL fold metallo-hydrolase n=1 Tax=Micavibrio aeruginosavorus TaxID=349221 RepID=A0A2W5N3D2_9BACT|nr:MAG: MBL fold metallo-hydrolase [Micavibrio aeruginosavorus]
MDGELIILGCGGSAGVPTIGNWWGACDPAEPKNIRTRPSVALKTANTLVVVDTSPDFRDQMNREELECPQAIIITHAHSDHINGLDELRTLQRLNNMRTFDIYALPETQATLDKRLEYMFKNSEDGFYPTVCTPVAVTPHKEFSIGDLSFLPFAQAHGSLTSLGLRMGSIAYSTDVKSLGQGAFDALKGIDIWVVDGAGHNSPQNPVHASISEIIEMNAVIKAKQVFLTHLPPTMDYATLKRELPQNYLPAYDGMVLKFKI